MKNVLLFGLVTAIGSVVMLPVLAQTNIAITDPTSVSTGGSDNTLVGVGAGNRNMSGNGNLIMGRAAEHLGQLQ